MLGVSPPSPCCACLVALLSLGLLPRAEPSVPLEEFYPFGPEQGDAQTLAQDDGGSGLLQISEEFPFFGERHTGLYVNNNGLVSFLREVSQFTPVAFPIAGDRRVLAPFWADVDNRRAGQVFYRESRAPELLQRASAHIRVYFSQFPEFSCTWVLVATWHKVTFFGGSAVTPVNTFQAVLITDGDLSFTIFQYHLVSWTTGMHASSGGDLAGLGGIAAQAGFNAGDGQRYFNIPGSRTEDVVDVEETTNVGYPGRWVFRVDHAQVEVGGCNDSASVCLHLKPCENGGRCIDDCIPGKPSFTCSCLAGFTGRRCQIDLDECASQPCQNAGTCEDQVNSFSCLCPRGYTGTLCETDLDECASQPCVNGGVCVDQVDGYTCSCSAHRTGTHCEAELFEAQVNSSSSQAENQTALCGAEGCAPGQVCLYSSPDTYNCTCSPGFYGDKCEEQCLCQNGGLCLDLNGTCECPSGYTGIHCQFEVTQTPCSNSRPCPDGGSCLEYGGTYLCTCHTGVLDMDPNPYPYVQPRSVCESGPCQNGGFCYERDGGYSCECKHGYRGKNCEKVRNACASAPCRNGASCKEAEGSYICVCSYRFTGRHCEVGKPDPCVSSPCMNGGTCFHYIGKYKCECPAGFSGRHCEVTHSAHTATGSDCGPPPPLKHAEVQFSSSFAGSLAVYTCHPGYSPQTRATHSICGGQGAWSQPPLCQEVNECVSQPCLNGATCLDMVDSYLCVCEEGFTGTHCQTEEDSCESTPCLNGGVCRGYRQTPLCVCKEGFLGNRCQTLENPCVLQPCGNRGLCRSDWRGNYSCACRVGHTGKACEKDLLPPSGLRMLRVEESEVELRWDQPDPQSQVTAFAVTYAPLEGGARKTDFLDGLQSSYLLQGLLPGVLYNISTFSVKRNANNNDISQPAVALIRTRPSRVDQLQVVNVSSSQVWLRWLLQVSHHAAVSQVRLSLAPPGGSGARTALLNSSTTEYTFSSLLPGQQYSVDVFTQSGLRPDEFPSTSRSAGPLQVWTRPLPPQNLSLSHVTTNSAHITWDRPPVNVPDGFMVNVTRGLNTRSRFLSGGRQGAYTLRDLSPGQHYQLSLTTVTNTGQAQLHSLPQHLAFTTLPMEDGLGRRARPGVGGQGSVRTLTPSEPQDLELTGERELTGEMNRYTELRDSRGRVTARFSNLSRKPLRHRAKPEPPVKLERMEETTNKISLALEIQEEGSRRQPEGSRDCRGVPCQNGGTCVKGSEAFICDCPSGFKGRQCELFCQRTPHPCTRLYSETKSVPVWEGDVCRYLYKRTYKVQQDVCYREICDPLLPKKSSSRLCVYLKCVCVLKECVCVCV